MSRIHFMPRLKVARSVLGPGRRFTQEAVRRAFARRKMDGWVPNLPDEGPAYECVSFTSAAHPLASIVDAARNGRQHFSIADLHRRLGVHPFTERSLDTLARAGLGVIRVDGQYMYLCPIDPRAARLINTARLRPQKGLPR